MVSTISAVKFHPFAFCAASWECAATWHVTWRGKGKEESGGLGEKTRKGKGGLQPGCPPSPGLSPQASGKPILRKNSTQIIKKRTKGTDHRSKPLLRKNSTQTIKNTSGINAHKKVSSKIKNGTISIVPFTYDISPLPESETPGTVAPTASPVPTDGGRSSPTWTAADPPAA